ncbi:MAG: hypothetical protein K5869_02280 [Saccharofermentans sp.]|nr:hypothetical protein [Saccharofermentans sp.]
MRRILTVIVLLMAVLLTSCTEKYDLDELKIRDSAAYPGWHVRQASGYKGDLRDFRYVDLTYYSNGKGKSKMDQEISYMVFESTAAARSYFNIWKDYCLKDKEDERQSGANWFISRQPDTYDMIAYTMYYLEWNVIIRADVELTYYSTENGGTTSVGVSESEGNQIKNYILENHAKLRDNAMKMLTK